MTDYTPLLIWGLGALLTLGGYGTKLLWDIRDHLTRLNGRVATCEELRKAHEHSDQRLHDKCEERIEAVEQKLMEARP